VHDGDTRGGAYLFCGVKIELDRLTLEKVPNKLLICRVNGLLRTRGKRIFYLCQVVATVNGVALALSVNATA